MGDILPLIVIIVVIIVICLIVWVVDACRLKMDKKTELSERLKFVTEEYVQKKKILDDQESLIRDELDPLLNQYKTIDNALKAKADLYNERLKCLIDENIDYFPQLASMMADLKTQHYEESADYLEKKLHPALIEAKRIRELRQETKSLLEEKKLTDYKIAYIRELFPDIEKYVDKGFFSEEVEKQNEKIQEEKIVDNVKKYISDEEYRTLSTTKRNQLALDNYLSGRKSKWQVGRDYELYIGYIYNKKGYMIEYNGIIKQLEDMGRDVIATKDNTRLIIQCKNWSQEKIIHEKHIFQLYGSVILARIENPFYDTNGVFVTTTALSDTAKSIAEYLDIKVCEHLPLGKFPRIKCNINKTTGEKIYHLPFDQQYDSTKIENEGEFMAFTVAEAEENGFRRAWKHTFSEL